MAEKRVIEQTASSEIYNDDWFLKDSVSEGTSKISKDNLINEIGASKINAIAEEYDSTSTYNKDDFAFYENKLYRCLANNTTGTWDGTKWEEFDLPTALITTAHNIETAEFTIGTYYSADDLVLKDGKLYQCVVGHNATEWKSQFWRSVTIDEMLGYLSSSLAPEHNPSTVYAVGDLVTHNKALWRCTQAGAGSFVDANWEEVTVSALIAEISDNLTADGISYDNTTSGLEADDVQEAIDEVVADIESVETALETKADVDGFYDELYAGNLLSDNVETDNTPYTYRQSPSGKSCVDLSVVGGTVAWNQLVQNGNFASTSGWSSEGGASLSVNNNTCTITGSSSNSGIYQQFNFSSNHKVLITAEVKNATENNTTIIRFGGNNVASITGTTNWTKATIIYNTSSSTNYYTIRVGEQTAQARNCMLIDLTQAFGSTIADYVYTLEQATAGSGIAWLKSNGFLTKDYYPYDSGSLQSVKTSGRKIVGKNLFDISTLVQGSINNSGAEFNNPSFPQYRRTNYIFVQKGIYVISRKTATDWWKCYLYDMSKTPIGGNYYFNKASTLSETITISDDCYIRFAFDYTPTSENEIQLELGTTATQYEPYTSTTYDLSGEHEVNRKFGVVDLGTLTWSKGAAAWNTSSLSTLIKLPATNNDVPQLIISSKPYKPVSSNMDTGVAGTYEVVINRNNGNLSWRYPIDAYTDADAFKTAMNGVYLIYELATPTTETVTNPELRGVLKLDANNKLYYYGDTMSDIPNPQLVGSTEEFIDTRDVPIPVGGERKYYTDLKAKLEELAKIPDVPSTNGTYTLKATRSASGVTYSWVSG